MGLFGRTDPPSQPSRPKARTIPTLDPEYFESIHRRLIANGGSAEVTEIAYGVGNAIYNTGLKVLRLSYATKTAKAFEALYVGRSSLDRSVPDKMIDFLVADDPACQSGESGYLGTLLTRLDDVLSRPA